MNSDDIVLDIVFEYFKRDYGFSSPIKEKEEELGRKLSIYERRIAVYERMDFYKRTNETRLMYLTAKYVQGFENIADTHQLNFLLIRLFNSSFRRLYREGGEFYKKGKESRLEYLALSEKNHNLII